jgi:hypothetical protein
LPSPFPRSPQDPTSKALKEEEHLKEMYPEEFAELYKEALESLPKFGAGEGLRQYAAEGAALRTLWEHHGIVK